MINLAATELRRMAVKLDRAERRIATGRLSGKVVAVDPDKRLLRLKLGISKTGADVLSPWVRWQEPAAGGMKVHSQPAMGEQMDLVSRSGTVGDLSIAVPATYDKDHASPSKSTTTAVLEREAAHLELGPNGFLLVGPVEIRGDVKIEGAVDINGDHVSHNDHDIGSTHRHTNVFPGAALTGPPT